MNQGNATTQPPELVKDEQVLILPGHLFFIEEVEVPTDVDHNEIAEFAELSMESVSPFPIEQLCWGYLRDEDNGALLLYATHRDRLKQQGYTDLEAYAWVLPDFATLAGSRFPEPTELILETGDGVGVYHYAKGKSVPHIALNRGWMGDTPEQALEELRGEAPSLGDYTPYIHLKPANTELSEQGLPTFTYDLVESTLGRQDYNVWSQLKPSESTLWLADVRNANFKASERAARRLSAVLYRISGWAAIFALLLIVLEGVLLGGQTWLKGQFAQVQQQNSPVAKIQEQRSLIDKLEQVFQNEVRPVAMLEMLNEFRPKGIYFTSTATDIENHITIEGVAQSVNELNQYADTLKKSGRFTLMGDPKYITKKGVTTFTVTLGYEHQEAAEPAPAPEEAETKEAVNS